jgi:hypothetical protein
MPADPGSRGFSLCSSTAIVRPPLIVASQVGEARRGRQWGNFPGSPGAPASIPTVCHPLVVVVTLGENGGKASTVATEPAAPAAATRTVSDDHHVYNTPSSQTSAAATTNLQPRKQYAYGSGCLRRTGQGNLTNCH